MTFYVLLLLVSTKYKHAYHKIDVAYYANYFFRDIFIRTGHIAWRRPNNDNKKVEINNIEYLFSFIYNHAFFLLTYVLLDFALVSPY